VLSAVSVRAALADKGRGAAHWNPTGPSAVAAAVNRSGSDTFVPAFLLPMRWPFQVDLPVTVSHYAHACKFINASRSECGSGSW